MNRKIDSIEIHDSYIIVPLERYGDCEFVLNVIPREESIRYSYYVAIYKDEYVEEEGDMDWEYLTTLETDYDGRVLSYNHGCVLEGGIPLVFGEGIDFSNEVFR